MDWVQLLNAQRLGCPVIDTTKNRTEFQRDYDRIVFSPQFRRLQGKTQVFPFPETDMTHNRLTHSLEVSSVGRSLGMSIGTFLQNKNDIADANNIAQITAVACLAHDIGNPPFGHSGESAISYFFEKNTTTLSGLNPQQREDFLKFEGNAMGFRMLTTHNINKTKVEGGLGLTLATLSAFTKYPCSSHITKNPGYIEQKKFGFFQSEETIFKIVSNETKLHALGPNTWCRHPIAFIVEAADDICYSLIDLEDGYNLKLISYNEAEEILLEIACYQNSEEIKNNLAKIIDFREKIGYLRAKAIGALIDQCVDSFKNNYSSIIDGNFHQSLIKDCISQPSLEKINDISKQKLYKYASVLQIEAAGFEVLPGLLEIFIPAILETGKKNQKIKELIPTQYIRENDESNYIKIMNIVEYIASMTDNYAVKAYRALKGINLPNI